MPNYSKLCAVLFSLFLSTAGAFAQWSPASSGTTNNLNGSYLLDSGVGFAVGNAGTVLKTTDGGLSWLALSAGTTQSLYDIYFFNDAEGVTVGDNGLILRTIDGGASWQTISSGVRDSLRAVSFNGANGICGGTSQDILYSTDSGASWHVSQKGFFGGGFFGAQMVSPTLGFVAGQNSIFQAFLGTTVDGGVTWNFQPFYFDGNEGNCDDVFFFDANTGLTSGVLFDGRGALTRTTNGGSSWITSLYPQAIHGIDFPQPGSGFSVGEVGTILHSADMGQTWSPQSSGTSSELLDVHFATNALSGIAVGATGTIVRTSNGGGGGDEFALIAAASRKGRFDIELPLDGTVGIESRSGGRKRQYTIVCNFDHLVTAVDGATTSCGEVVGTKISRTNSPQVIVSLVHVRCNAEVVTITLNGVHDDQGGVIESTSIEMGLLLGDADGNGLVEANDVRQIKDDRGQEAESSNFREDINTNGQIEASDVNLATAAVGTMLAP